MGRRRRRQDQWMPPRVYRAKSAYEWHPKGGGAIRLCGLQAERSSVWKRYEQELSKAGCQSGSVRELIEKFFRSEVFQDLSPTTKQDYRKHSAKILAVFGSMDRNDVRPKQIRQYMDRRGRRSKIQANREKAFFSRVCSWAFERGLVANNPCKGVRRFNEKPRDRYVTDKEYETVYEAAPTRLKVALEIAYLCAARKSDILRLKRSDLLEDGIFITQGKTGKKQIKRWTPRLRAAVALAKQQRQEVSSLYVLHNGIGRPYSSSALDSAFQKAKKAAALKYGIATDFTFHDLKAKGISDYEGDKQRFSGHKTQAQVAVYDRKVDVVDPVE